MFKKIFSPVFFIILLTFSINYLLSCDEQNNEFLPTATPTNEGSSATPTFNPATCSLCHGFPPSTGKHQKHNSSYCCGCYQCHVDSVDETFNLESKHDNGTIDVDFAGGGYWDGSGCFGLSSGCHGDRLW